MMTINHARWNEFIGLLEGPDGCNFRRRKNSTSIVWTCMGGNDRSLATALLERMGFKPDFITASLTYFKEHGGHCDCEILFNVAQIASLPRKPADKETGGRKENG